MALSECIGSCIAYYPPTMERFLDMEGIFRLLDLLEVRLMIKKQGTTTCFISLTYVYFPFSRYPQGQPHLFTLPTAFFNFAIILAAWIS